MKPAGKMRKVQSGRWTLEYRLQASRSAKKMRIRVDPSGVVVVASRGGDPKRADAFVLENRRWVMAQQAATQRLRVRRAAASAATFVLYRGQRHRLEAEKRAKLSVDIHTNANVIRLAIPERSRHGPEVHLRRWLRAEARREIMATVAARARQMHRRYRHVYLRSQRTKWGNCSPLRNLSFNWRLIMAPHEVLDYIVVHELAHLAEQRHTRRFWLIVQSYCPDYAQRQAWLRDHQSELYGE